MLLGDLPKKLQLDRRLAGECHEVNYSGSTEENRLITLNIAHATGLSERMRDLVHTCMAEYDLTGWTAPDLINPDDVSWLPKR